ncbi:hypothetical protein PROFUN_06073 [Planoprotostelium fungivorum]|uniref:Uncharacterized protein n=1 Tax=Planoprotostelium fungivorum TaxID=1890364 RepID=A0A2P6NPR2_9EUKA|nr:hypothetical protein PROFUN_06073 [Planoprotostelium fungivorum]
MEKSTAPKKKKQKVDHNPRYVHLFMLEKETFRRLLMNNRNVQRRTRQFHSLKEVDKSLRHLDAEALEQYLSQPKSNKTVLAHLEKQPNSS